MLALVNGMGAVKSPNLMDGKEYKGHTKNKGISLEMLLPALMFHYPYVDGCCEFHQI